MSLLVVSSSVLNTITYMKEKIYSELITTKLRVCDSDRQIKTAPIKVILTNQFILKGFMLRRSK